MRDRTHWDGCWEVHHKCALVRIKQLEEQIKKMEVALRRIRMVAFEAMNTIDNLKAQLDMNQIMFEVDRVWKGEDNDSGVSTT